MLGIRWSPAAGVGTKNLFDVVNGAVAALDIEGNHNNISQVAIFTPNSKNGLKWWYNPGTKRVLLYLINMHLTSKYFQIYDIGH